MPQRRRVRAGDPPTPPTARRRAADRADRRPARRPAPTAAADAPRPRPPAAARRRDVAAEAVGPRLLRLRRRSVGAGDPGLRDLSARVPEDRAVPTTRSSTSARRYQLDGKFKEAIAAFDKVITDYPAGQSRARRVLQARGDVQPPQPERQGARVVRSRHQRLSRTRKRAVSPSRCSIVSAAARRDEYARPERRGTTRAERGHSERTIDGQREQSDSGRQSGPRCGAQVHPERLPDLELQPRHHRPAQGQGQPVAGQDRVASHQAARQAGRVAPGLSEEGQADLRRGPHRDPQLGRQGRSEEVHDRDHRRPHPAARQPRGGGGGRSRGGDDSRLAAAYEPGPRARSAGR